MVLTGAFWKLHQLVFGFLELETPYIGSGQIIATSAEVTPNGGLVRESPPKMALN